MLYAFSQYVCGLDTVEWVTVRYSSSRLEASNSVTEERFELWWESGSSTPHRADHDALGGGESHHIEQSKGYFNEGY